jgi:tetratricopeptide (TPR) repeat protein
VQSLGKVSGLLLALLCASPANAADDPPFVQILSATVRDQKIPGATVILQRNGRQSRTATTNEAGRATVDPSTADDPAALIIVRKEGYSDLVAKCPCTGLTYAVSPILSRLDELRIVLNWNRNPEDLDAHLAYGDSHVFFDSKEGDDAQLDVDQMRGFGPETITITRRHPGTRYVYGVQNYTHKATPINSRLSTSGAKVFIYVGRTLVRSYYVPMDQAGNLWTVFAISAEGEIQDINTMTQVVAYNYRELSSERLFGPREQPQVARDAASAGVSASTFSESRRLNTEGEAAYQRGDYARAIELFQAAIEQHGNYGQAYSNLGLTFQKSGRVAEALWANRKAIALAVGSPGARTRASTHFNNGRIYENAGQWNDALREYLSAASEKPGPTYDAAIQRMRDKGAR